MLLPLHLNLGVQADVTPTEYPGTHEPITEYYLVTIAEINEVTDTTNILIWDEDSYNAGKVWG